MINHPDYQNGNIYLSGGMQFAPDGLGAGWRKICSERLKAMKFLPLDIAALDLAYIDAHGYIKRWVNDNELLQRKSNIRKHYIDTDINLIKYDSDAVIILYDETVRRGAGTTSEVHEAFMRDVPVFMMNTYGALSEVPGWMQAETTRIFNDWEDMYDYLGKLPPGILKRDKYGNHRSGDKYLCSLCGATERKHGAHFVSKISPLYCKSCVELVQTTYEEQADRYQFFLDLFTAEACETLNQQPH